MIFAPKQAGGERSTETSEEAQFIFLEMEAWGMPINSRKVPAGKAFLQGYLKETGLHGYITQPIQVKLKKEKPALCSAGIVQKVKNTVRVF